MELLARGGCHQQEQQHGEACRGLWPKQRFVCTAGAVLCGEATSGQVWWLLWPCRSRCAHVYSGRLDSCACVHAFPITHAAHKVITYYIYCIPEYRDFFTAEIGF